ncbi:hypothetical protein NDU88_001410 [Pleurodeles waltl]|uniref:Uncharacterized protein n=1 Tax=Pleurodeles waltl TaxID=8319 RepID=A0AAV7THR4_PLEWA|nr:hypothetical protein NDU88_001410 [Pleurodeles waltl]
MQHELSNSKQQAAWASSMRRSNPAASMEDQSTIQQINLEEILKAARVAASMYSKEWIPRQISGDVASERPSQEMPNEEEHSQTSREEMDRADEPKKHQ